MDDRSFITKLRFATSDAVGSPLGSEYRDTLKAMAEDEESLSNPS